MDSDAEVESGLSAQVDVAAALERVWQTGTTEAVSLFPRASATRRGRCPGYAKLPPECAARAARGAPAQDGHHPLGAGHR